jgi:GR25 family glycosyltransferase involved in LPS biosynthesis
MNVSKPPSRISRLLYALLSQWRLRLSRQRCRSFTQQQAAGIGPIYVINLDRQPQRWSAVLRELSRVLDADGSPLSERTIRFSACDARSQAGPTFDRSEIELLYNLGDQLFVEPQPLFVPEAFDLIRPIMMSRQEVAVASSHIGVWKEIAQSDAPYALILEDDVWIQRRFGRMLDSAWREMEDLDQSSPSFDVFYVSYQEVRFGAAKQLLSQNVFRPERGLWYLSGYVLSKRGAEKLLSLLPVRGPIDLWINHKFRDVDVRALRRSVINQRLDTPSSNSHSVLPALSRIGVLDYDQAAISRVCIWAAWNWTVISGYGAFYARLPLLQ